MLEFIRSLCLGIILLILTVGSATAEISPPKEGAKVGQATIDATEPGKVLFFDIEAKEKNYQVGVAFRGELISGSLQVKITNRQEQVIWHETVASPGPFVVNTVVKMPEPGMYKLILAHDGPAKAKYSLEWMSGKIDIPTVSPVALIGGLGMIAVALAFVGYAAINKLGWRYLGLGALLWVVTVALKIAWAIPMNPLVHSLMAPLPDVIDKLLFELYIGTLTGIFEVGITWIVLRYTRLGKAAWKSALSFGIGFGAIEAFLLGLGSLGAVTAAILIPDRLPLDFLKQFSQSNFLFFLAPIWERFFAVLIHIYTNVLIFYAVVQRRPGWFWLAFVYKSLIDAAAAFYLLNNIQGLVQIWCMEGIVAVWGIAGYAGTLWVKRHYDILRSGRDY